jgi:hypothetical protein
MMYSRKLVGRLESCKWDDEIGDEWHSTQLTPLDQQFWDQVCCHKFAKLSTIRAYRLSQYVKSSDYIIR